MLNIFIERLRLLRDSNSRQFIATKLNVPNTTYCNWETGASELSTNMIKSIAILHNVSSDYLLGLSDDPAPYSPTQNISNQY